MKWISNVRVTSWWAFPNKYNVNDTEHFQPKISTHILTACIRQLYLRFHMYIYSYICIYVSV